MQKHRLCWQGSSELILGVDELDRVNLAEMFKVRDLNSVTITRIAEDSDRVLIVSTTAPVILGEQDVQTTAPIVIP